MGFCKRRHLFLTLCVLQLVTVVERQVFDFLGFLWISLLVNFLQIIFTIFGFFGAYQYRPKYIISYLLWQLAWIAWNIFLICLYLNVAGLDHETNKVLKLDYKSDSWWKKNGPGCKVVNVEESKYDGCLIDYVHIEVFQSGLQVVLTVFSCIIGTCLSRTFLEEDDTSSHKSTRKTSKQSMSLYSIEFSSQMDRHGDSDNDLDQSPSSPKPMTPRRVKRRSVMQRGSSGRHSTSSRRQSHARSSTRSSRRMQNPVTKLLEQQQKCQAYESATSQSPVESPIHHNHHNYYGNPSTLNPQNWQGPMGHTNPSYQQSTTSLNEDFDDLYNNRPASVRSSYSNFHGARANYSPTKQYHHHHSHATPQVPQKRSNLRNSMRNMAFMNNGPPAYTVQAAMQVDNETPM
ncbi:sodium/potassium-transporting ATPase subunit beta-1-interacting protein [Anthonomus grandis grandis]|uniref:sodium/potassium-transporting ATPase subunit beta-1-interacting protein n=1 Tax=Anthonomus grandis grandis TaxID=2921223 RepID=UPI00216641AD|nr:sodium/potassium-transporting ATPase subunit beta-1-interacting protein [Anthonomus grandis grandis]